MSHGTLFVVKHVGLLSVLFWILGFVTIPIPAQHTRDSSIIRDMNRLYRTVGLAPPSIAFPVDDRDIFSWTDELLENTSDPLVGAEVLALREAVRVNDSEMEIGVDLETTVVGTTEDLSRDLVNDYGRVYNLQEPFLRLRFFLEHPSGVRLSIREERQRELRRAAYWNTPLFPAGKPFATENNSIREGTISAHAGPLQFTFGRQKLTMGPSPVTSLIINPDVPFVDGLRVTGRFGGLTMTYLTASLENREALNDVTILSESPEFYNFDRNLIYFNIHYFEYHFGRLRAGIGSSVVLAREMNEFHLTDFFPVASWHNANVAPNNHSLFADVSVVAVPGVELYAAIGLDDFNGESVGVSDSDIPTISATTLGISGGHRLDGAGAGISEMKLRYLAEVGRTHYLWGNYRDGLELSRGIYRMDLFGENRWMPLTSRYGPGVTWGLAEAEVTRPVSRDLTLSAGASLEITWQIDGINLTDTGYGEISDIDSRSRTTATRVETPLGVQFRKLLSIRIVPMVSGDDRDFQPGLRGAVTVTLRGRHTETVE